MKKKVKDTKELKGKYVKANEWLGDSESDNSSIEDGFTALEKREKNVKKYA